MYFPGIFSTFVVLSNCFEPIFGQLSLRPRGFCTPYKQCNRCQGQCDKDTDCKGDLVCFIRDSDTSSAIAKVPGCDHDWNEKPTKEFCVSPDDYQCGDVSSFRDNKGKTRDCGWVSQNKQERCGCYSMECRETCGYCRTDKRNPGYDCNMHDGCFNRCETFYDPGSDGDWDPSSAASDLFYCAKYNCQSHTDDDWWWWIVDDDAFETYARCLVNTCEDWPVSYNEMMAEEDRDTYYIYDEDDAYRIFSGFQRDCELNCFRGIYGT